MAFLATGAQLDGYPDIRESMYRTRHKIFHVELGWEVSSVGGLEYDRFDTPETVYILYVRDGEVIGTWRLLPTTGAYMLADVFAELVDGVVPRGAHTWELSRYAIDKAKLIGHDEVSRRRDFELVMHDMVCTLCEFSLLYGIEDYVLVQHPGVTALANQAFGFPYFKTEPVRVGKDLAQVCYYRPAFAAQLRDICEYQGFARPVTSSFSLGHAPLKLVAAE